jgi:hypothetical protein
VAIVNREADKLVQMNREADEATIAAARNRKAELPIRMEATSETTPYRVQGLQVDDHERICFRARIASVIPLSESPERP